MENDNNLFADLLTSLVIGAEDMGITRTEIISSLGFNKTTTKLVERHHDLFGKDELKYDAVNAVISRALSTSSEKTIQNILGRLSADTLRYMSLVDSVDESRKHMSSIMLFIENNDVCQAELLEDYSLNRPADDKGFNEAKFSEAKRSILDRIPLGNQPRKKLKNLFDYVETRKESRVSSFRFSDINKFFLSNLPAPYANCPTLANLVGTYVVFKRSNFKDDDNERPMAVSLLEIYEKAEYEYRFKFVTDEVKARAKFIHRGIVFRDSTHSIKLLGYKKNPLEDEYTCLQYISLSVSNKAENKNFYNGGILELKDSDNDPKPYHTWIHLSRLDDRERLLKQLERSKKTQELVYTEPSSGFKTILYETKRDEFKTDKIIEKISSHLKDQYSYEKPSEPREYIFEKLLLMNEDKDAKKLQDAL
jgi:hypothetical protein